MRATATTLALGLCVYAASSGLRVNAQELDLLQVVSAGATHRFVVIGAAFGGALPRIADAKPDTPPLRLVQAAIAQDCQKIEAHEEAIDGATAVMMERGGACSFVQKALAVQTTGASLLIVGDSIQGAYASSKQSGRAIYDCSAGCGYVVQNASSDATYPMVDEIEDGLEACAASDACLTGTCVYTGSTRKFGSNFEVCCFSNTFVRMDVDSTSELLASGVTMPAVFASYSDTQQLKTLLAEDSGLELQAFNAEENPWNVSMLLTWLLGVMIVVGGAYCSATDERRFSYEKVAMGFAPLPSDSIETQYISIDDHGLSTPRPSQGGGNDENTDQGSGNERVELSTKHALYFVVGSSTILVLLYYGFLAMLMNVLFLIATTASMTHVVVLPVLTSLLPLRFIADTKREFVLALASISVAGIFTIYWFVHRSSAYIWPLQDLLCVSLCFVVIDSIQLPNLKVATALLGVAFLYDIFFVYISPLVFGSSVMVDVASGNGGTQASASPTVVHEKLPMVLSIPLLFSYYGGSALLGLGDLILPGLLVSLCIRYDYCMGYPLSRNYFMVSSISYAAGLLLANTMAIALRDVIAGQPALMYIVPMTLGSVMILAASKHELDDLWEGPLCLRMELALTLEMKAEQPARREEIQPFLKKQ